MTPAHCFKFRSLVLVTVLVCGLGLITQATAQESRPYLVDLNSRSATDLGTLYAFGINDAGQVVGGSSTAEGDLHAFITGPNGIGMRDLGTLGGNFSEAFGINDAGQVVGVSSPAESVRVHTFITGPDGMGMRDLGTLGYSSSPYGINDAGQVAGSFGTAEGFSHAFITGPDGMGMRDERLGHARRE